MTFDSNANRMVIFADDGQNANASVNLIFQSTTLTPNLTAENYIGISDAAYTNGATASIQITGSVDDAQSGLTAGEAYYVQLDGTLSTTPDNPSVFAGTALSATELLIGKSDATSPSVSVTASGSLANGDLVVVNADGTVSVVAETVVNEPSAGTAEVFSTSYTSSDYAVTYDSANNKIVISYRDGLNSSYGTTIVGTVSGESISFGTPVVFNSSTTTYLTSTYDSANGKVVIAYTDNANSSAGTSIVGTVSGTSISFGTAAVFSSVITADISITYDSTNNKIVIAYKNGYNTNGSSVVGTVSGTSISFGAVVIFNSADAASYTSTAYDSANNKIVISYKDNGNSNFGTAIVGTVSGTSISFGTAVVFSNSSTDYTATTYDSANGKVVIAYQDVGNSGNATAIVGTVSGTSISFGTAVTFRSANCLYFKSAYDSASDKIVISYSNLSNSEYGNVIVGTVSGTSISFSNSIVFESASTTNLGLAYDSTNDKTVIAYRDNGNSNSGTTVIVSTQTITQNLTAENYIGVSNGAYSDAATANVHIVGSVNNAQSGLTAGQAYYVQLDGTLATTPDTTSVFAGTAISSTRLIVKG
jgi:hypothetical protein